MLSPKEAKALRDEQNQTLTANGYTWHKMGWDGESDDYRLDLVSPDGRIVTRAQALDEITQGREVVLAEITAEETAAEEAAEAVKLEQETKDAAIFAAFDTELENVRNFAEVESFDTADAETIASTSGVSGTYRAHDQIQRKVISDVTCYVTITGTGLDSDGYYRYYSEDPAKAGLTPKPAETETDEPSFF